MRVKMLAKFRRIGQYSLIFVRPGGGFVGTIRESYRLPSILMDDGDSIRMQTDNALWVRGIRWVGEIQRHWMGAVLRGETRNSTRT